MALVQTGALGLRERRVRGVADQRAAEAQPAVRGDQQVALGEPVARPLDVRARHARGQRLDRRRVAAVAGDRGERERRALGRAEPVEPCRQQGVQGGRERLGRRPLADEGDELLEEQRIAAGRRDDPLLAAVRAREVRDQRPAGGGGERVQHQLGPAGRPPAGSSARAIQTSSTGTSSQRCQHRGEEVEQGGLGAVRVVDDEHQRPLRASAPSRWPNAHTRLPPASSSARPTAAATRRAAAGGIASVRRELLPRPVAARLHDRLSERPQRHALAARGTVAGEHGPWPRRSAPPRAATCRSRARRAG